MEDYHQKRSEQIRRFLKIGGIPKMDQNGWFIMGNRVEMDLGVAPFLKTCICRNIQSSHIQLSSSRSRLSVYCLLVMFISFYQTLIILSYSINGHSTIIHTCTICENIRYSPIVVYIYNK
jgi:hypothetical protein